MTWQPALPRLEIALLFASVYWVSHSGFAFGSLRGPFLSGSSGPDGSRSSYSPDLFLARQLLLDLNPCSAFKCFGCCPLGPRLPSREWGVRLFMSTKRWSSGGFLVLYTPSGSLLQLTLSYATLSLCNEKAFQEHIPLIRF